MFPGPAVGGYRALDLIDPSAVTPSGKLNYGNGLFLPPSLQMLENQVEVRQREVVELQSQVKALGQEVKDTDEVDGRRQLLERKFQELLDPLRRRRNFLVASREVHQFNRDVEDEIVRKPHQLFSEVSGG